LVVIGKSDKELYRKDAQRAAEQCLWEAFPQSEGRGNEIKKKKV